MLEFGNFNTTYITVHEASCIVTHNFPPSKHSLGTKHQLLFEKVQTFLMRLFPSQFRHQITGLENDLNTNMKDIMLGVLAPYLGLVATRAAIFGTCAQCACAAVFTVHCSAVQCSALQRSLFTVHCSAVQCATVFTVHCSHRLGGMKHN
jgi:hypothetical protein